MDGLSKINESDWLGDVDASAWERLLEQRGGCRCCISPPCFACTEPPTEEELNALGYTYKERRDAKGATHD